MITGWLVKLVVSIALVGFLAVELGAPLVTRAQLDDLAHDAADNAALELLNSADVERARAVAGEILQDKDATLKEFAVDQQGRVVLTTEREARSFLLKNWSTTDSWYDVEVEVTSEKRPT
ncbi:MAG: hypothetical protein CYG61_01285 [Actinobacteria bacterium]|nr:MAG: hypothetical protein CYG61_01285 [Actinomycetota bacterium]